MTQTVAHGNDRRGLTHAVALENRPPNRIEEVGELWRDGTATTDDEIEITAQSLAPATIDKYIGTEVLDAIPKRTMF